jgi:hypothetical protein
MSDAATIVNSEPSARPPMKLIFVRAVAVAVGLGLWFGSQALLGAREYPPSISPYDLEEAGRVLLAGDAILVGTAKWNQSLAENEQAANALLISSSFVIDALGIFLLTWAIFGPSLRPFVGLLCLFALRQACQVMCALPAPPGMIWHDPGFPSLLVTYSVANDFFYSGHTALAVFGALELGRLNRRNLAVIAAAIAIYEMAAVLILRAHWTLDVFTGAIAAMYVSRTLRWLGPWCDERLSRLVGGSPYESA